jgi:hypothetical protein
MKIWNIIKEDFEKTTLNESVDEGWKEKVLAGALATSVALGGKGMDKPAKEDPKKIEYTSTKSEAASNELSTIKRGFAEILKQNTTEFNDFRNYYSTIDFLNNFDIYNVSDKMAVVDYYGNKYYIDINSDIELQIKNIVKNRLSSTLRKMKEDRIVSIINQIK